MGEGRQEEAGGKGLSPCSLFEGPSRWGWARENIGTQSPGWSSEDYPTRPGLDLCLRMRVRRRDLRVNNKVVEFLTHLNFHS